MRQSCELLANSLHQYACEIQGKNKVMKSIHSSTSPWRSIENGMGIVYVKPAGNVCSELQGISSQLTDTNPYSLVDLRHYLPLDNQKRYFMIKNLKAGLSVSALLLIYSTVNNCGNSWHVPYNSMMVIEEIKKSTFQFITQEQ